MVQQFTWIPFYEETADKLLKWRDHQKELIRFLDDLRKEGLKPSPLNDKFAEDDAVGFLLEEIDPFTFFGSFNRQMGDKHRFAILSRVKEFLSIDSKVPEDLSGIPILQPLNSWFIAFHYNRDIEDVDRLWDVFEAALPINPLSNKNFIPLFNDALKVERTKLNLTFGLFWIRPNTFLGLDKYNRKYLSINIPKNFNFTGEFYIDTLKKISARDESFPEISWKAWQQRTSSDDSSSSTNDENDEPESFETFPIENSYWMVGAYWDDKDPPDQTDRFLRDGIWENGWPDKHLDRVRSMLVGDRIAIKTASTKKRGLPFDNDEKSISWMIVKAIGTITKNHGDGKTVDVEWDKNFKRKDWYFYTQRGTVWRLRLDDKKALKLIDFAFYGKSQDHDWFLRQKYQDPDSAISLDTGTASPYSIADAIDEGVFLDNSQLEQILGRMRSKQNIILQGPPGVGKTFIARKLAYALMEKRDNRRIEMVQFHQSYSYEDFIRGYRPMPDEPGSFGIHDGKFFEFCSKAENDSDYDYVFIIDEINRGNLSQIFGELMMLIESDKRGPEYALPLMYRQPNDPKFFIPENLFIIGLMNLADRSLAMVDYALRRRFAFLTLHPCFDKPVFRDWLAGRGMEDGLINLIVSRIGNLNTTISEDTTLGPNYQIGHSFFCPREDDFGNLTRDWYDEIVRTEIAPLLDEYWFDNRDKAEGEKRSLLAP